MEDLTSAVAFLKNLLNAPVILASNGIFDTENFEKTYCLFPQHQPAMQSENLRKMVQNMEKNTIYEIHDSLETTLLSFWLHDTMILIGPYSEMEWNDKNGERILVKLGILSHYFTDYKLYRCRLSVLSAQYVTRLLQAFLFTAGTNYSEYTYKSIMSSYAAELQSISIPTEHTYESVNHRYELETIFINSLKEGETGKCLYALSQMRSPEQRPEFVATNTWNRLVGASIIRTLCRIAAKESGLSPIIIDSISQEYAQKLHLVKDPNKSPLINQLISEMITRLCQEIQKFKQQDSSYIARKAIHYIQLNFSYPLTASSIAAEFQISPSYLSRQIKKATGSSVTQFIMKERSKKAAELLITTNYQIQNISNYVGYTDNNYFVKIFKSQYGVTPTEYRNKYGL